jgi:hypothetical protein
MEKKILPPHDHHLHPRRHPHRRHQALKHHQSQLEKHQDLHPAGIILNINIC